MSGTALAMTQAIRAAQQGRLEEVTSLLDAGGVTVNSRDLKGCTLLHWASINGRLDVMKLLISRGADVNAVGGSLRETSLQWATRKVSKADSSEAPRSLGVNDLLCLAGLHRSTLALMYHPKGDLLVLSTLCRSGANLHHRNSEGRDAFFISVMTEWRQCAMFLKTQGAEVNSTDAEGLTPMLAACKYHGNNLSLIRTLLALGANPSAHDLHGNSGLHLAIKAGHHVVDLARVFKRYGAETRVSALHGSPLQSLSVALRPNDQGEEPYTLCKSRGETGAMKYMLRLKVVHAVPAPAVFMAPPLVLVSSLTVARSFGLTPAALILLLGVVVAHWAKPAFTARQEDCLGVGITLALFFTLAGEYWRHLLSAGALVDLSLSAMLFVVLVLLSKMMTSEPGRVNAPGHDVLGSLFEDRRLAAAPAAGTNGPVWESRRRCESCFAKRLPRVKHCHACQACVHRYDHHCHFVGNCVGAGNHRLFLCLIGAAIPTLLLWALAAGRVLLHASPAHWHTIIHGGNRDLIIACLCAFLCTLWLVVLGAFQMALIGLDTTSFELLCQRRLASASPPPRSHTRTMTVRLFVANVLRFWLDPSHRRIPDNLQGKPMRCSLDDEQPCSLV